MAKPGLLFIGLTPASQMLVGEQGTIGSNEIGAAMKNGVSCLAIGIGLLSETLFAFGHTPSSTVVAQLPTSVRPSGVLTTTPPAPVAVPPSGVLPTLKRRAVTTLPFKSVPKMQTTKRSRSVRMSRHVVHSRLAARHQTTRTTTVAATPPVATTPEQPGQEGTGYELLLSQLGKGKVSK